MIGRRSAGAVGAAFSTAALVWLLTILNTPAQSRIQMPTVERLEGARWWPTKDSAARADYVGPAACASCHRAKAESQARTAMARTATRAAESEVLGARPLLTFVTAPYRHTITTKSGTSIYSVSDGDRTATAVLGWAFGMGRVGQTFLFERDGTLYETRASYFGALDALHFTPGRTLDAPRTVDDAMARPLVRSEARRCVGCHTTASSVSGVLSLAGMTPGVTCEACHGPGRAHVEAMREHREDDGLAAIVNPAGFGPIDSVDFCGACHATYWDVILAGQKGIAALRSQPFRLQSSRCWGEGDRRITCVACHDPHAPLEHDASVYAVRCLACHMQAGLPGESAPGAPTRTRSEAVAPQAPACRANATGQCATCHMPKYAAPEMHFTFTDHLIRVVRNPGAAH